MNIYQQSNKLQEFKVSAYNIIDQSDKNKYLIANTLTGAVLKLPLSTDTNILEILNTPNNPILVKDNNSTATLLIENGFIVASDLDELDLKQAWFMLNEEFNIQKNTRNDSFNAL